MKWVSDGRNSVEKEDDSVSGYCWFPLYLRVFTPFGALWVIKAGVRRATGRLHRSWDAVSVGFVSVTQVRSPCDARSYPGGGETARYLCLNERSGLMRPGKIRRLPGGDLLNSPKRTTRNTKQKGGHGGTSTHRTPCPPAVGARPLDLLLLETFYFE